VGELEGKIEKSGFKVWVDTAWMRDGKGMRGVGTSVANIKSRGEVG